MPTTLSQKISQKVFAEALKNFPGGVNSPVRAFNGIRTDDNQTPFITAKGSGAFIFDVDGNPYLDMINSWGPLVLGHAHPQVVKNLCDQVSRGTSYGTPTEQENILAAKVKELMPNIEMLRFVNSGTEAGMSVLRLARAYTKRPTILKFSGCYHGHVDDLMISGGSGIATLGLTANPDASKNSSTLVIIAEFNDFDEIRKIFTQCGEQIAAVIVEPVCGNAGFIKPQDNFLSKLREITTEHGSLLIFDEVMTGFRVSLAGAQGIYDIKPDLTMLGKVIGGGLPVGAYGGRKEIMRHIAPQGKVYQAGTLSGNPLAMVGGYETLRVWSDAYSTVYNSVNSVYNKDYPSAMAFVGAQTENLVSELQKIGGEEIQLDSLGAMFGFFFAKEKISNFTMAKTKVDHERYKRFFWEMLRRHVYLPPSSYEACFVNLPFFEKVNLEDLPDNQASSTLRAALEDKTPAEYFVKSFADSLEASK